ncbi:DUF4393 domain-containing protein [Azoarcus communis]|uniref:DUF4393 domain-containing protein n=1 Tax=Parazoarcus communis TaxID=41977 RepID=UPI0014599B11|nr:DUF4393 domain-containing protein [Parazoarcus communis]NMG49188.1 DUF4393 domain-containing protein [Parazoarcus communis]
MSNECEKDKQDSCNNESSSSSAASLSGGALTELASIVVKDPKFKKATHNICHTAVTLTETFNNILLPFTAINSGIAKARKYFEEKFQSDLSEKLKAIPEKDLVEPKLYIAGPAVQGLALSHEDTCLKDMYLNLLKSSMDIKTTELAHPAFVEIIKQLTAYEAILLNGLLSDLEIEHAIVEYIKISKTDRSWTTISRHVMNLSTSEGEFIYIPYIESWVDNWSRLGLVDADYSTRLVEDNAYDWVNQMDDFKNLISNFESEKYNISYREGVLRITGFGKSFSKAVGISQ